MNNSLKTLAALMTLAWHKRLCPATVIKAANACANVAVRSLQHVHSGVCGFSAPGQLRRGRKARDSRAEMLQRTQRPLR